MDLYKVAVFILVFLFSHGDGFGFRTRRSAQRVSGEFQYERRGGRGGLLGLGLAGRTPGLISQGLHNLAGGVHNILNSAKETLSRPFSVEINAQIGHTDRRNNHYNDRRPGQQQNPSNPDTGNDYQQRYETPNQNNNRYDSNPDNPDRPTQQNNHQPQSSSQSDSESGEIHMYIENNFPVILLNQNEIR